MTSKLKKRKVLATSGNFQLVEQRRDNKTWYELKVDYWAGTVAYPYVDRPVQSEMRDHFGKGFGPTAMTTWRFWNRKEAHHQYLYAVLRWS